MPLPGPPSSRPGIDRHLRHHPTPTPHSVPTGTVLPQERLIRIPRRPQYRVTPSLHPITFSVRGMPGPYLTDILEDRIQLDGANDAVFERYGWRTTNWLIDVRSVTGWTE